MTGLWSAREENGRVLRERRENVRLLPGVPIPESVELTTDVARATQGADLWVSAVPTVYLRPTFHKLTGLIPPALPVLSLTKGVEVDTFLRPSEWKELRQKHVRIVREEQTYLEINVPNGKVRPRQAVSMPGAVEVSGQ